MPTNFEFVCRLRPKISKYQSVLFTRGSKHKSEVVSLLDLHIYALRKVIKHACGKNSDVANSVTLFYTFLTNVTDTKVLNILTEMSDHVIVVAIDFGTTYSGYAFSLGVEFESQPTKISSNKPWTASQGLGTYIRAGSSFYHQHTLLLI